MYEINFTIPGEPCAQGRPHFSTQDGYFRAIDPEKSRNYKAFVKYIAAKEADDQGWLYTELPIKVNIKAYLPIPSSKSKKFKADAIAGIERPTKKPDVDNLFKSITDAMSGILYKDDKQIVSATIGKWYAEEPRAEVHIEVVY